MAGLRVRSAKSLGFRVELVSRWKRELDQYREASFSGNGNPRMTEEQTDIARLKKELKEAQIERDILKKVAAVERQASFSGTPIPLRWLIFQFMKQHAHQFAIEKMCRVLGVSRSGYYCAAAASG